MLTKEYDASTENNMVIFYHSLSEKDRRRYAAVEAQKIGHGGILYMSILFGCDEKTIQRGIKDLKNNKLLQEESQRKAGAGRKSIEGKYKNINEIFLQILRDHTAGSPMDATIKWTNLSKSEIKIKLSKRGIKVSSKTIGKLLKRNGFRKRKALKKKSTGEHKDRDQQFKIIEKLRSKYEASDDPVISVDAKKKELIGDLYREGTLECTEATEVLDHDFPHLAEMKVTPYAVYDTKNNEAFVNLGTTDDTSDFACDSIALWWKTIGKRNFPNSTSILILADGGGSNSSRHHVFKESLQNLSNKLNLEVRVAHYPPYTSKWNPIEHRLFPHITRSLSGVILANIALMRELVEKTSTTTGLKVFCRICKKIYTSGKKAAADFYEKANIRFNKKLGQWNYTVNPV